MIQQIQSWKHFKQDHEISILNAKNIIRETAMIVRLTSVSYLSSDCDIEKDKSYR